MQRLFERIDAYYCSGIVSRIKTFRLCQKVLVRDRCIPLQQADPVEEAEPTVHLKSNRAGAICSPKRRYSKSQTPLGVLNDKYQPYK